MTRLRVLAVSGKAVSRVTLPLIELFSNLPSLESLSFTFKFREMQLCRGFSQAEPLFRIPQSNLTNIRLVSFYTQPYLPDDLLLGLDTLEEVHLTRNDFVTVPRHLFAHTPSLKIMNFSSNAISYLPVGLFDNLALLEKVDLEGNSLLRINPFVFLSLFLSSKLKEIDLSYNGITDVSQTPVSPIGSQTDLLVTLGIKLFVNSEIFEQKVLLRNQKEPLCLPPALNNSAVRIIRIKFEASNLMSLPLILDALNIRNIQSSELGGEMPHYIITVAKNEDFVCTCDDISYFSNVSHFHFIDAGKMSCRSPHEYKPLFQFEKQSIVENQTCKILHVTPEDCPLYLDCEFDLNKNSIRVRTVGSNLDLQELPHRLPPIPTFIGGWANFIRTYHIDLSASGITALGPRDYFKHTIFLNLSYNRITHVNDKVSELLVFISVIYLNSNQLTSLPDSLQVINYNSSLIRELHLYNNPWSCDCQSRWMKYWLHSLESIVMHPKAMTCARNDVRRGKPLIELEDDMFQCRYILSSAQYTTLVVGGSTLGLAAVIGTICWIIYRKRHWMYMTFNVHPFDMDECIGEDMEFDLFVSYANENEDFVEACIEWLETEQGFSVCYHRRDFLPGSGALDNIHRAVTRSRRTLCYVTSDFLKSEWCIWEFITALNLDLEHKRHRLIIIKDEGLDVNSVTNVLVRDHLRRFTFIERGSAHFTHQLLYSLPQKRLHQHLLLQDANQLELNEH
jgi:Leucine-rich repeat (LRR) protein